MTYRIVARQDSLTGPASERYQVVDDEGRRYCLDADGIARDTPDFRLAVECYCELTGEDPDNVDGCHDFEIDGVRQFYFRRDDRCY